MEEKTSIGTRVEYSCCGRINSEETDIGCDKSTNHSMPNKTNENDDKYQIFSTHSSLSDELLKNIN